MSNRRMRSEATAVVSRKLAGDLIVTNIYGKQVPNMVMCQCGIWKFKSEFYLESESKRNHLWQVRYQCAVCWDLLKGKNPKPSYSPTNSLETFMEEDHA